MAYLGRDVRAGEELARAALHKIQGAEVLSPENEKAFAELVASWDLLILLKIIDEGKFFPAVIVTCFFDVLQDFV